MRFETGASEPLESVESFNGVTDIPKINLESRYKSGEEQVCMSGLDRFGWNLPEYGQRVVICFSTEHVPNSTKLYWDGEDLFHDEGMRMMVILYYTITTCLINNLGREAQSFYWWPEYIDAE